MFLCRSLSVIGYCADEAVHDPERKRARKMRRETERKKMKNQKINLQIKNWRKLKIKKPEKEKKYKH